MLCSRASRSSVPSSTPPWERRRNVAGMMCPTVRSWRSSSEELGGRSRCAGAVRAGGDDVPCARRSSHWGRSGSDRRPKLFGGRRGRAHRTWRPARNRPGSDGERSRASEAPAQPVARVTWATRRRVPFRPAEAAARHRALTVVTSQLYGSQHRPSFLPGTGVTLREDRGRSAPSKNVWARDGQAPARAQTLIRPRARQWTSGVTSAVQYLHRFAAIGIELRHSGQSRSVASATRCLRSSSFAIGSTIRK